MHACRRPLIIERYLYNAQALDARPPGQSSSLAVAAVPELPVFSDLQLGGVGGGDAVAGLHAVALLQLGQSAHQTGVCCIQRCYALLLHTQIQKIQLEGAEMYVFFL